MRSKIKACTWLISAAIFLFGAVSLYPCATGSETVSTAKKSCHSEKGNQPAEGDQAGSGKEKAKPCCTLHCYNPAQSQALFAFSRPARVTLPIENVDAILISLTIAPPNLPPQVGEV
ncbi:hypothetical protein [Turneriella parva]|uniref:hypothetical protein n=1 Tax=Turneriella parva TaxID=29510 RepID=UPI0005A5566D|nr:hypothetical protein [Turneriella parva]